MQHYTGIGSRSTPEDILRLMQSIAEKLADLGWTLRSGAAQGADSWFEGGARQAHERGAPKPEIFLPWALFNGRYREDVAREKPQTEAFEIAARHHPAWERLSQGARRLHARNVHQILGCDVTQPALSSFVICWTPQASGSGGTGQALRIAKHYGIPIFDLGDPAVATRLTAFLGS